MLIDNRAQLWSPLGFAHAAAVPAADAGVLYKTTDLHAPRCSRGPALDGADPGIDWPVASSRTVLSDRDRRNSRLRDLSGYFTHFS